MRPAGAALFFAVRLGLFGQSASIVGTVVDQTTGKPVERVHIRLASYGSDHPGLYGAISDSSGRFSMAPMPAGSYDIRADKAGYVQSPDSDRVTLKPGQQMADYKLFVARAAMLLGRVVDQNGDPVPDINVRMTPAPPGKLSPTLVLGEYSQTDDRGEFHILTGPGKYYLSAEPQSSGRIGPPEVRSDGSQQAVYATTYYPASENQERAAVVEVIAGHDIEGLEIHLSTAAPQRLFSASGVVTNLPEDGFVYVEFSPADRTEGQSNVLPIRVSAGGKFSVSGLQAGAYDAVARSIGSSKALFARARIRLEAGDVNDLELGLREPAALSGVLEIQGEAAGARKVRLYPAGPGNMFGGGTASAEVGADGSFRIADVPPLKFRVTVEPLPDNAYIKVVELSGTAMPGGTIDLLGDSNPRLKITAATDGAMISGTLFDEDVEASEELRVVLLASPNETPRWPTRKDGAYTFKAIPPGKYRLSTVKRGAEIDTQKLFTQGEEIEVHSGDQIHKDLRVGDAKR